MIDLPADATVDLRVYVRDLTTGQWTVYPAAKWVDEFCDRVSGAMDGFLDNFGGTFTVSGTAESGRITVTRPDGSAAIDVDWYTRTADDPPAEEVPDTQAG